MRPYTPAATRYLWTVIGIGWSLMLICLWQGEGAALRWPTFALLTALGAIAHLYPVRSAQQKTRYVVGNTFVFTAVVLLDPHLLMLHCAAIMLPFTLRNQHRPRIWYGYAFNSAQMALAAFLAHSLIAATGGPQLSSAPGLLAMTLAASLYTLAQALLVGIVIALNNQVPLRKTDALAPRALVAEAVQPFVGVVVAALWLSTPWVLAVLPIPVLVMYMLVRQVHVVQSAEIDAKTGLYNYKYFLQALAEELNRSPWVKRPLSVLFADMDYLRSVNNQWGHLAGDEVLKQLAEIIRHQIRPGDVVARFGGEEFVVMLPGTDIEQALHMAERVRAAVAAWPFAIGGGRSIHCTISIGAACSPIHGTDGSALVEAADGALYQAKAAGRNRVFRAPDGAVPGPAGAAAAAAAAAAVQGSAPPTALTAPSGPGRASALLARLLLWAVVAGGGGALALGLLQMPAVPAPLLAGLITLGALAGWTKVRLWEGDSQQLTLTLSHAIIMAAVGTAGLPAAVLTAWGGSVARELSGGKRDLALENRLFELFRPVLSAALAAGLYTLVAGLERGLASIHLVAAVLGALAYYLANTGLATAVVSLGSGKRLGAAWREQVWFAPASIFLGLSGAFVGIAFQAVGWLGALLLTSPVLVLRYTLSAYAVRAQSSIAALEKTKAEVEQAHAAQRRTLNELIETVAAIIDARDSATYGHSRQVAKYAVAIARELGLSDAAVESVRTAALLHDLGKVGVPEAILGKPDRLTDAEYAIVKQHASIGERILSEVSALGEVARIVGEHHEKVNGSGYPQGKAGEDITLGGRIIAVADALDSMLSDRPYSVGRPLEEALAELVRCADQHFDARVVTAAHQMVVNLGPGAFSKSARAPHEDGAPGQVAISR